MIKKNENLIKMNEVAKLAGERYSTIKFYTENGLLPFSQEETGLVRWFDKNETLRRLREINKLKEARFTISEIKEKIK